MDRTEKPEFEKTDWDAIRKFDDHELQYMKYMTVKAEELPKKDK